MPFFDEVPPEPGPSFPAVDRRSEQRFTVPPDLPLKAGLSLVGRDDTGAPMSDSRHNWNWKGHLVDFSGEGARMQMGPGVRAAVGDTCDLLLTIEGIEVTVPSQIANIRETAEGTVVGLKHCIDNENTWGAYRLLLEVVSLGTTLEEQFKRNEADEFGYLVEQYASPWGSRLTVWREPKRKAVAAFEFVLNDGMVRAADGQELEYLSGQDAATAQPASYEKIGEIHRLFHWVAPSLAPVVPSDVKQFVQRYA